ILMPALIVSAGLIVKLGLATVSGRSVPMSQLATVTLKAAPWAFFVGAIKFATNSLTANTTLVTKVAFPRAVFPLASTLSALFDFAIASLIVIIMLAITGVGVSVHLLWVPILLGLLAAQVAGLALLLAAGNLFFRDIKYIVEVVLMFAIFFTPVFYEAEMFGRWGTLLMLNPVAPILEGLNAAVVHHQAPALGWTAYAAGAAAMLALGPSVFQHLEPMFAESV